MRVVFIESVAAAALFLGLALPVFPPTQRHTPVPAGQDRIEAPSQSANPSTFHSFRPVGGRKPAESSQAESSPSEGTYQRIRRLPNGYSLEYGFKNFNGDALQLRAQLDAETVAQSVREFGFRESDLKKLADWHQQARTQALARAKTQKELDSALDALAAEHRRRRNEFYQNAGFRYVGDKTISADVPALIRRNIRRVDPVAQAFSAISGSRRYGAEELVGAVTAMAQTALRYEVPPNETAASRVIGGILPPPQALVLGQGDCDTKTALIAGILRHWPNLRMVGLELPEHYLMAVQRAPRKGDVYIEFEGFPYVMIESAGPAWIPPGEVGEFTLSYLESGKQFRIQPI
ncbi:MAG: hypothetical protein WCU88_13715 [Elusimicrobiota bacterium]|jgi:predicted TIM-barrel fold metal-dependent hydrolase